MLDWHTKTTENMLSPRHHGQTAQAADVHHSVPLSLSLSVLLSYSCIGTILHPIRCPALALFADGRTGHRFFFLLHCCCHGVQGDILSINVGVYNIHNVNQPSQFSCTLIEIIQTIEFSSCSVAVGLEIRIFLPRSFPPCHLQHHLRESNNIDVSCLFITFHYLVSFLSF